MMVRKFFILNPMGCIIIISCGAEGPPSIRLSVCLSRLVLMYYRETLQVCAPCHGGVLYSF